MANPTFFDDPIGTILRQTDNGQRVPVTRTKTAYSLTIHARVGTRQGVIGAIHEISTRQRQDVDEEYEVDALGQGLPREMVPQIVSSRTIQLRRYDLYSATIEQVFGAPTELVTLANQIGPVSLRFMWKAPTANDLNLLLPNQTQLVAFEYTDCYITDLGRTVSTSDIIVKADASLVWRNCRQLQ
jgi:hypothetical protein